MLGRADDWALPGTVRNSSEEHDGNGPSNVNNWQDFRNGQEHHAEPIYEGVPDVPPVPEKSTATLERVTPEEREHIIRIRKSGVTRRDMCQALGKGKKYYEIVKAVLDEEEL